MAISDDDAKIRQGWKVGSGVSIFSNSRKKWFNGEVAQIFHDDEGEWLEIRYDRSMSKQVQRYSSDIKPTDEQKQEYNRRKLAESKKKAKSNKPAVSADFPFPQQEMDVRKSWSKSDDVEIFSNTHQEWYRGEIVDIIKDDEGEWLNVVWARANGEAMSKQVQRFSTDVRPAQDDTDSDSSEKDRNEIIIRLKDGFKRRAPPFSRTLPASTFSYPATNVIRQKKKLQDIEEKDEVRTPREADVADWTESQVVQFIAGLGKQYVKYKKQFRDINGMQLIQMDDSKFEKLGMPNLHRLKIQIELAKLSQRNKFLEETKAVQVLNWDPKRVKKWAVKQHLVSQYATNFQQHGIDGLLLLDLGENDLATIGVKQHHIKPILNTIQELKRFEFPNDPSVAKRHNADEKDEEVTVKTSKRRPSVRMTATDLARIHEEELPEREDLLEAMAEMLLVLGGALIGFEKVPQAKQNVEEKYNAYKAAKKAMSQLQHGNNRNGMNGNVSINHISTSNGSRDDEDAELDFDEDDDELDKDKSNNIMKRMSEKLDAAESPAGVGYARSWINTIQQKKGHKRRQSLPYINSNASALAEVDDDSLDNDEDDEDALSDLETQDVE